jgi:hypothetical protein
MRARDQLAQRWAEHKEARDREEARRRDQVIAEFDGDLRALADEILRLRHGMTQLADAIDWMKKGGPFVMLSPGPLWKPKPEEADDHGC